MNVELSQFKTSFWEGESISKIILNEIFYSHKVEEIPKKDQCKEIMVKLFGPATARLVESMKEEECVVICRQKAKGLLGEDSAKLFDAVK